MKSTSKGNSSTSEIAKMLAQREAELSLINTVQNGIAGKMEMQEIYHLLGDKIRELFDAQVVMIASFLPDEKKERFHYFYENGKLHFPEPRTFNNTRQQLINNKEFICVNEDADKAASVVPGTKPPKSMVFFPFITGNSVTGYLSLQNLDRENAFSNSDIQLLGTITNSISIALENARLFNETEQRNAELAVINSVQEGLVAEMDMQGIFDLVGDRIQEIFDAQAVGIHTFDHDQGIYRFDYLFEDGQRYYPPPTEIDVIRRRIIENRTVWVINEDTQRIFTEITGVTAAANAPGTKPAQSLVFVPMLVGETVRGYVTLQDVDREHAFSESDVQLLATLTNSMTIALENARLFDETNRLLTETEQRAAEMQTVNNISRALVSQLELDKLIELVGNQMKDTFKADIVYLALYDTESEMLHFPYTYGETIHSRPFGNNITEKIIKNRKPLLVNQELEKTYEQLKLEKKGDWVESFMGVPIIAGKESIGVISVQSKNTSTRFNEYDQRLLTTIAANVGVAIQNAEAYQKLQSALTNLRAAQEQLVQQEKLSSLGQLTAGIAHEIKNPLNFVTNFSDVSLEMIDEALEELQKIGKNEHAAETVAILADIKSNLTKIHEHGTRADGIVKSMLQHSRGGSGKMEPVDLNVMIKEYVNLSYHGMRAGKNPINVDIDLQLDDSICEVPLIAEDFSRVILNLCNNGFDAMKEKLSSQQPSGDQTSAPYLPKLTARTKSDGNTITIEFEDNGPGIPDEIKDKILQPFFTTKKGTQGTGLGLSITNDIIKAHRGILEIKSEKNGTIMTIKQIYHS